MIVLRWREVRPVTLRWIGPSPMAPPLRTPEGQAVAAIVGPPGSPGKSFQHVQASPSAEWIVNHNLGVRPSVTVLSPGGVEVSASVIHASPNQLRVSFAQPQSGSVHCV